MKSTTPLALGLCLAPLLGACRGLLQPALLRTEPVDVERALARYPAGTESVELFTPDGALRGLFVPAEAGAPVVLHLLDSGTSCAGERVDLGELTRQLADLGCASLVCDYAGTGLSDGERSVAHLARDARLAWDEAVRRAGGAPERVVVRALSIGTIAAAELLEHGARPAAMVWIAPVFPDSVVTRFALATSCGPVALVAWLLFRPVSTVDPPALVARAGVPVCLIASHEDELSRPAEREALARAVRTAGGEVSWLAGTHLLLAARARWILSPELALYRRLGTPDVAGRLARTLAALPPETAALFGDGSPERARLAELCAWQDPTAPEWLAACARTDNETETSARLLWLLRRRPYPPLPAEDLVDVVSQADPGGALPFELVESDSLPGDLALRYGGLSLYPGTDRLARIARDHGRWGSTSYSVSVARGFTAEVRLEGTQRWQEVRARSANDDDAERRFLRIALQAERIPQRLARRADGGLALEVFENGLWHPLAPADPGKR